MSTSTSTSTQQKDTSMVTSTMVLHAIRHDHDRVSKLRVRETDSVKAISTTNVTGALFEDERLRVFYAEVKTLINDCFNSLYETVMSEHTNAREQKVKFLKGLSFVSSEMSKDTNYSEIVRVTYAFPRIKTNYQRAMSRFAEHIIPREVLHQGQIRCPLFDGFLFDLYRRVAMSSEMRSMRYFSMTYAEQEVFIKDVLRITMSSCLDHIVDPTVAASKDGDDEVTLKNTTRNTTSSVVRPSDSVSNINNNNNNSTSSLRDKKHRREKSILSEAITRATTGSLPFQPPIIEGDENDDESLSVFLKTQEEKRQKKSITTTTPSSIGRFKSVSINNGRQIEQQENASESKSDAVTVMSASLLHVSHHASQHAASQHAASQAELKPSSRKVTAMSKVQSVPSFGLSDQLSDQQSTLSNSTLSPSELVF